MIEITIGVDPGATKTKVVVIRNSAVIDELEFSASSQGSREQIISELILGIEKNQSYKFLKGSLHEITDSFPCKKIRDQLIPESSTTSDLAGLDSAALILSEQCLPEPII